LQRRLVFDQFGRRYWRPVRVCGFGPDGRILSINGETISAA